MDQFLKQLPEEVVKITDISQIADISEDIFDLATTNEVVKEIPVIKWLSAGYNAYNTIQDRLLFQKVLLFVKSTGTIAPKDKEAFLAKLSSDPNYKADVTENIFCVLGRLDNMQKPAFIGKIFSAYVSGFISYAEWLSLSHAVDKCTYLQLLDFEKFATTKDYTQRQMLGIDLETYYSAGLTRMQTEISVETSSPRKREYHGESEGEEIESKGILKFQFSAIGKKLMAILNGTIQSVWEAEKRDKITLSDVFF